MGASSNLMEINESHQWPAWAKDSAHVECWLDLVNIQQYPGDALSEADRPGVWMPGTVKGTGASRTVMLPSITCKDGSNMEVLTKEARIGGTWWRGNVSKIRPRQPYSLDDPMALVQEGHEIDYFDGQVYWEGHVQRAYDDRTVMIRLDKLGISHRCRATNLRRGMVWSHAASTSSFRGWHPRVHRRSAKAALKIETGIYSTVAEAASRERLHGHEDDIQRAFVQLWEGSRSISTCISQMARSAVTGSVLFPSIVSKLWGTTQPVNARSNVSLTDCLQLRYERLKAPARSTNTVQGIPPSKSSEGGVDDRVDDLVGLSSVGPSQPRGHAGHRAAADLMRPASLSLQWIDDNSDDTQLLPVDVEFAIGTVIKSPPGSMRWACIECTFDNPSTTPVCRVCRCSRPQLGNVTECERCTRHNSIDCEICASCGVSVSSPHTTHRRKRRRGTKSVKPVAAHGFSVDQESMFFDEHRVPLWHKSDRRVVKGPRRFELFNLLVNKSNAYDIHVKERQQRSVIGSAIYETTRLEDAVDYKKPRLSRDSSDSEAADITNTKCSMLFRPKLHGASCDVTTLMGIPNPILEEGTARWEKIASGALRRERVDRRKQRVKLWDSSEGRVIEGESAPTRRELGNVLANNDSLTIYSGQDIDSIDIWAVRHASCIVRCEGPRYWTKPPQPKSKPPATRLRSRLERALELAAAASEGNCKGGFVMDVLTALCRDAIDAYEDVIGSIDQGSRKDLASKDSTITQLKRRIVDEQKSTQSLKEELDAVKAQYKLIVEEGGNLKVTRSMLMTNYAYFRTELLSFSSPSTVVETDPNRPYVFRSAANNMGIVQEVFSIGLKSFFDCRLRGTRKPFWTCVEQDPSKRKDNDGTENLATNSSRLMQWEDICKRWQAGQFAYMEQHDQGHRYENNLLAQLRPEDLQPRPLSDIYTDERSDGNPLRLFLSIMKDDPHLSNVTPWHQDKWAQVIVNVYGRKLWKVHPPIADERFFAGREESARFVQSDCTQVFELAPGDVFYLPARWMHEVSTFGPSCTINWGFTQIDQPLNRQRKTLPNGRLMEPELRGARSLLV